MNYGVRVWKWQPYDLGPSSGLDWMVVRVRETPRPSRSFLEDSVTWLAWVSYIQSAQSVALSSRRGGPLIR